jgi:gas vesicle protein
MNNSERVAWLLIGGAVGAGIALLYAPQSGKETRKLIRRSAEDTRDAIAAKGESITEAGRELYRKGAGIAATMTEGASDILERGRRVVRG